MPTHHRNRGARGNERADKTAPPLTTQQKKTAGPGTQDLAGLQPRRAATKLVEAVLGQGKTLDITLGEHAAVAPFSRMEERDRALARAIAATALRRKGQIDAIFDSFLERPLKGKTVAFYAIARAALAEILFMNAPDHAVVNLAVQQARADKRTRHLARLLNAVLRKASVNGPGLAAAQDAALINTPDWLWQNWVRAHGEEKARALAEANLQEAALDITVKSDPESWARRLGGEQVGPVTVRLAQRGRIETLDGFEDGQWWVQDAAAALPARLLGNVAGMRVADLCAAPGGKTAQLAWAGARVTALDISASRLARLRDNLERLALNAEIVATDVNEFETENRFDAVLLDAPCSATGTIRRHPDIPHLKRPSDIEKLSEVQARLLNKAVSLTKPGGKLVYCTCSLEPEEGEEQITRITSSGAPVTVERIAGQEAARCSHTATAQGFIRTWPFASPQGSGDAPADGFFIARLSVDARQC